jgi:hypothetical protein
MSICCLNCTHERACSGSSPPACIYPSRHPTFLTLRGYGSGFAVEALPHRLNYTRFFE